MTADLCGSCGRALRKGCVTCHVCGAVTLTESDRLLDTTMRELAKPDRPATILPFKKRA